MDDKEKLAWAAGLYEGEGSCFVRRRNDRATNFFQLGMSLRMANKEPITLFRDVIGVGHLYGPYPRSTYKPIWELHITAEKDVDTAINKLYENLSRERKEQIALAWEKTYGI